MRINVAVLVCALVLLSSAARGEVTGYEALANWSDLPNAKIGVTAGLASSYDRAGGNNDFNQYLSPAGFQDSTLQTDPSVPTVIAEIDGPGVLTRFWMPHAAAKKAFLVKITIDGTTVIQTTSDVLLQGSYGYMNSPLVSTQLGGQVSYEPIVFTRSLKIESENKKAVGWQPGNYYQYNYRRLPSSDGLLAYSGALTPAQQADRAAVAAMIAAAGSNPAGAAPAAFTLEQGAQSISPGSSLTLGALRGSGQVRRLNVKMDGATDAALDGLRLRVRYDNRSSLAIDVPVSQFFGAGHARVAYRSLPLGTAGEQGFYSYWPMPYRQGIVVELYNGTGAAIAIDSAAMEYQAGPVAKDAGYLHAAYCEETTTTGQAYHVLLNVQGEGHYVGNLLYLQRSDVWRSVLEGDDVIVVDGATTMYGTGLEDSYNGGYYYNHIVVRTDEGEVAYPYSGIGPYAGLLRMNFDTVGDTYIRTDQYRWLIGDCVPFTQGIQVKIENWSQKAGTLFGSTAFYYLVLRGDYSGDGQVNQADYTVWADHYGQAGVQAADGNGDGVVNQADYTIWADNYGRGAQTPAIQQAAEPAVASAPAADAAAPVPAATAAGKSLSSKNAAALQRAERRKAVEDLRAKRAAARAARQAGAASR